jgi:hypothetical protein
MQPSTRFDYVAYDDTAQEQQKLFKEKFQHLEASVGALGQGRAQSLILTKLEEAYMWVGKAVRDEQIKRNGSAPLQEGRGKE